MKQRLSFVLACSSVYSKFLTRFLHRSTQRLDRSITHRTAIGTNPDLPCTAFSSLGKLHCHLKTDFRHNLWINLLQCLLNHLWMMAVVEQNRRLCQFHRLLSEVVHILAQHLNQTLVIANEFRSRLLLTKLELIAWTKVEKRSL